MKMKRSEKLGMLTGLVVGVLLLLISVFMIFQTTCKVWGSQITPTQAEKNGLENSFRYTDGKLKSTTERMTRSLTRVVKPSNATAQGIDVSYHQGTIDWEKVKNSGQVDFAIIRCGIGMDQTNQDDTQWENNTSECERLGIPYGTFLYSYADTVEKARSEAQHVVRLVQGKNLTYPIYYDMEDNSVMNKIDSKTAGEIAQTFLNTLEANGYKNVAVYSSKSLFETKLTADIFNRYPRWVAHYNDTCGYQGSYHMWQYTNKGKVSGITTNVDLDYSYKDYTKIVTPRTHALTKTDTGSNETEKPSEDVKVQEGWKASGKKYWYQKADGTRAKKGWLTVGEDKFYLDANGYRVSGWKKIGGRYYYFGQKTGAMQTGWLKLGSKYYYLKADGTRATGWVKVNGGRYYLDKKGVRKYGWLTVGKKKYLLGTKTGKACTGWTKYRGKIYYFSTQTGQMRKGWLTFGDNKYYTKSNGVRAAGWTKIKGKWYYFNKKNGVMKKSCKVGKYRFDGNGVCANYKK